MKQHYIAGFTMIEVIVALVLVGIIAAASLAVLPRVNESEFAERLLLKSNLRYARQRSVDTTNNWSVSFSGSSYSLLREGVPGEVFPAIESGSHESKVTFSADGTVEFESPGGTLAGNVLRTITFAGGSVVEVHPTGAIR